VLWQVNYPSGPHLWQQGCQYSRGTIHLHWLPSETLRGMGMGSPRGGGGDKLKNTFRQLHLRWKWRR